MTKLPQRLFHILLIFLNIFWPAICNILEVNDHDGGLCDGECELSMSCYLAGGRVEPAGNCHSIFKASVFHY